MNRKMTLLVVAAIAALLGSIEPAMAASVQRTKRDIIRTRDANGNPVGIESDKGWKVFELRDSTTETQVTDEASVAPVYGVLHRVCVESSTAFPQNNDWVVVFDSSAQTGTTAGSRRLLPPLMRASSIMRCSEVLDVQFSLGLRVLQGAAPGTSYIYWRGYGDVR